jgi:hypothetical protein
MVVKSFIAFGPGLATNAIHGHKRMPGIDTSLIRKGVNY